MDLRELIEPFPEISPDESFAAVLAVMAAQRSAAVAVVVDRKVQGLITDRDVARHSAIPEVDTSEVRARDVMASPVEKLPATTAVIDAARVMRAQRIPYLAVTDAQGDYLGCVTLRAVLSEVMDELDLKVDNLERELMADGPGG
jgi:CBS domain-containing protein